MTKFEKETRHRLYVLIKKNNNNNGFKQLTRRNVRQLRTHLTRSVHLHGHDVLTVPFTVLLHCPNTSMMVQPSLLESGGGGGVGAVCTSDLPPLTFEEAKDLRLLREPQA